VVERWAGPVAENTSGQPSGVALNPTKDDQIGEDWNRAGALARVDGDETFLRELAELFIENCPPLLAELDAAVQKRDAGAIAKAAHTLKGNVASLGATAAYDQTRFLEEKAKACDLDDMEKFLAELNRRLGLFLAALQRFLIETGPGGSSELILAGCELNVPAT
jgi:two-component system sensor histidine kinase/response regulator